MSILHPFLEARAVLGVEASDDAAAIKRAYRKLALAHPPDTDPDGFRRVRDAYELLTEPATRVREMLLSPKPAVAPPKLPAIPELPPRDPLCIVLLRLAAANVDAGGLLDGPPGTGGNAPEAAPERNSSP
jgi:hypothetical protein